MDWNELKIFIISGVHNMRLIFKNINCQIIKAIFLTLFCLSSSNVFAFPYDKIVVFGDSLSDNGNIFQMSGGKIPRNPPYLMGRFSNELIWVDFFAEKLGIDTNSSDQFVDRAHGGAWAAESSYDPLGFFNFEWEVETYLDDYSSHDAKEGNHLFIVWIGNNDYINGDPTMNPNAATSETVNAIKKNIETLYANGARHFLVINLSNLGLTPKVRAKGPEESDRVSLLSQMHNKKLAIALEDLKNTHPDMDMIATDVMPTFNDIMMHPEKYHLTNINDACYDGDYGDMNENNSNITLTANKNLSSKLARQRLALLKGKFFTSAKATSSAYSTSAAAPAWTVCSNPDEHVYFDMLHPTTAMHRYFAEAIFKELQDNMKT